MIDKQFSFEVIHLVQKGPRQKSFSLYFMFSSAYIPVPQPYLQRALHVAENSGEAQASFLALLLPFEAEKLRVRQNVQHPTEKDNGQLQRNSCLRRRKPYTVMLVHEARHLGNNILQGSVKPCHRFCFLPEDGIGEYPQR